MIVPGYSTIGFRSGTPLLRHAWSVVHERSQQHHVLLLGPPLGWVMKRPRPGQTAHTRWLVVLCPVCLLRLMRPSYLHVYVCKYRYLHRELFLHCLALLSQCMHRKSICTIHTPLINISQVTFGFKTQHASLVNKVFRDAIPIDARTLARDPADFSDNRGRNGRDDDDVVMQVMSQHGAASLLAGAIEDPP